MLCCANWIGRAKRQIGEGDQYLDARGSLRRPGASQVSLRRRDVNKCPDPRLEGFGRGRIGLLGSLKECIRCFSPVLRSFQMGVSRPDFVFNLIPGNRHVSLRFASLRLCAGQLVASRAAIENGPTEIQLCRVRRYETR